MAGETTFGMLRVMVPVMFAATQLLLIIMVSIMARRIGDEVAATFLGVCLMTVGLSAVSAGYYPRIISVAQTVAAWARR